MAKDDADDMKAIVRQLQAQIAALQTETPGEKALALLAERSAPKNNPNYNEISVFTYPEGNLKRPKPKLTRETFFCGSRCREDELTPSEIEAFNAISKSKTARDGRWTATVTQNGTAHELHVSVPSKSADDRMGLPSLLLILAELEQGAKAVDPMALAAEVAELRDTLRELTK